MRIRIMQTILTSKTLSNQILKVMQKPISEFQKALEAVNGCEASLRCGCSLDEDDVFYSECLFNACRDYLKAYNLRNYGHE